MPDPEKNKAEEGVDAAMAKAQEHFKSLGCEVILIGDGPEGVDTLVGEIKKALASPLDSYKDPRTPAEIEADTAHAAHAKRIPR